MDNFEVRLILQSVKKTMRHAPYAKLAIEPWMLKLFYTHLDLTDTGDLALWCCILIAFFGFLRKSNVVPNSEASFNPEKQLTRGNIARCDYGLQLTLTWTKTIQCPNRVLKVPIVAIPGSDLDPVAAYDRLCNLVPAESSAPAFAYLRQGKLIPLTYPVLLSRLRALIQSLGLDPSLFGGHSLRRGGCSLAFRAGVPIELVKAHGDWKSMAYLRYLDFSDSQRCSVTQHMAAFLTQQ